MVFTPVKADTGMEAIAKKLAEHSRSVSLPKGAGQQTNKVEKLPPVSIVISRSLGDDDLLALMELSHNNPKQIGLVIIGLIDESKDISYTVLQFMEIAKRKGLNPALYVDPMLAREHEIKTAPTMVYRHLDKKIVVSGRTDFKTFESQMESQEVDVDYLGQQGSVVRIAERNLMDVMEERLSVIDWKKKAQDAIDRYWTKQATKWNLPTAKEDRIRVVDLSVTVEEDIRDHMGIVRFKKGQVVNPLDYRKFENAVIVFDGSKEEQLAAAKEMYMESKQMNLVPVLITTRLARPDKEALGELYEYFQDRVALLDDGFKKRFAIESLPSMVIPSGNEVKIIEVAVK